MSEHIHPMPGQVTRRVYNFSGSDQDALEVEADPYPEVPLEEANIFTSEVQYTGGTTHKLAIDLDLPAKLIPSSTEGHFHLIIDKAMPWEKYVNVLEALADAGIIEPGYCRASIARGFSSLRLPWIKKEEL